ncbi:ATP-binding cassette domain-containing protein [Alkalibaculum bacchi]|uniref:ATP-binding cassette domain-containing protein n=1 Tax=Alkalibaculum bacchi TaxID=645887 RepID=UPI0026ECBCD9|nr:ATP-binding cassette domain-containing protein [Alkalibaculum bacchi]
MMTEDLFSILHNQNLDEVLKTYPIVMDFLANYRLEDIPKDKPFIEALNQADDEILEEFGVDQYSMLLSLHSFLKTFTSEETALASVSSLTILGGFNKSREAESVSLKIQSGEIISIVGPTGSGKSRLLNDIECLAQEDTPTGRKILVNDREIDEDSRFEIEGKLVAQLSQNMNFVMDLTVQEFLEMHAKSRLTPKAKIVIEKCFTCANDLAGEKFSKDTKVTQLSGGQSRALMIADTAFMSNSPIVLIDEIENAGIDRRQAIELLARNDKIILVSTHDPLLALSADKRVVIKNGGMYKIIETSEEEKQSLAAIEKLDNIQHMLRQKLRFGHCITEDIFENLQIR